MKLNKIAINTKHIPAKYKTKDGFIKEDVSVALVFIQGNKKEQKELFSKLQKYCKLLRRTLPWTYV